MVRVKKYKRKDGTQVKSHSRSSSEHDLKYSAKDYKPSTIKKERFVVEYLDIVPIKNDIGRSEVWKPKLVRVPTTFDTHEDAFKYIQTMKPSYRKKAVVKSI